MLDSTYTLLLDGAALTWFLTCWIGYSYFAKKRAKTEGCLSTVMHMYRVQWLTAMMGHPNRMADMSVIATFERNTAFLGSSSLLILAGLLTMLGNVSDALELFLTIPFASQQSLLQIELKLSLLIIMFVFAFFKFTWSMRQISFAAILIGAAPDTNTEDVSEATQIDTAERIANVVSRASHHFNYGMRTYYFALAVLSWFINPWLFIAMASLVVYVTYRREFDSSVLRALMTNTPN